MGGWRENCALEPPLSLFYVVRKSKIPSIVLIERLSEGGLAAPFPAINLNFTLSGVLTGLKVMLGDQPL